MEGYRATLNWYNVSSFNSTSTTTFWVPKLLPTNDWTADQLKVLKLSFKVQIELVKRYLDGWNFVVLSCVDAAEETEMVSALYCSGMQDRCTPNAHYYLNEKETIWISGWYLTKLVIVQPPLCSGERGIQRSLSSCLLPSSSLLLLLHCSAVHYAHTMTVFENLCPFL